MELSQVICEEGFFYTAKICNLNKSFAYTEWMENMKFDKDKQGLNQNSIFEYTYMHIYAF